MTDTSISKLFGLSGISNPDRPIYDGTTPVRTFLVKYTRWASTYSWTGAKKAEHLVHCVSPDLEESIYRIIYGTTDDHSESEPKARSWSTVRKEFITFFGVSEDAKEDLKDQENLLRGPTMQMKNDESIVSFRQRFLDQIQLVDRLRKEVSGPEPPHPEELVNAQFKPKTISRFQPAGNGPFYPQTPSPKKLGSALAFNSPDDDQDDDEDPSSAKGKQRKAKKSKKKDTVLTTVCTIRDSDEYKERATVWQEWKAKHRPPLTATEISQMFLAKLNRTHYTRANRKFDDTSPLSKIVAYLAREESLAKQSQALQDGSGSKPERLRPSFPHLLRREGP